MQFSAALEARVDERTRIARELHDTLLQSFQGLLLVFQSVSNLLPARPEEAKQRMEHALDQASDAITEGRDAVHALRSGVTEHSGSRGGHKQIRQGPSEWRHNGNGSRVKYSG